MHQTQKHESKQESHKNNEHRNRQKNFLKLDLSEHFLLDPFSK